MGNPLLETNEVCKWRFGEGGVEKAELFYYGNGKDIIKASDEASERSKNYHWRPARLVH